MKKIVTLIGIIVAVAVIAGTVYVANVYLSKPGAEQPVVVACHVVHKKYSVNIRNGAALPVRTQASLCDVLTITNQDDRLRLMAFGPHNKHLVYDGVSETVLAQNQSLTITLNQSGTYEFHDHLQDTMIGYFTVASR